MHSDKVVYILLPSIPVSQMVFFSIVIPVHGTLFTFDVAASLIDRVDEMAPKQKYLWTVVDRYGSDAMISLLNLVHSLSI